MNYDLSKRTSAELLADWAGIMRELQQRKVIRTRNNPISDIAEEIVAKHFRGQRGESTQKGWDVRTGQTRIQVKAMRQGGGYRRTTLGVIRGKDFDKVVVVVFPEDFSIDQIKAYEFSKQFVFSKMDGVERFPHREHVNGRVINLTTTVLDDKAVKSINVRRAAHAVLDVTPSTT